MEELIKKAEQKMDKCVDVFKHELAHLRTGRASLSMLDNVKVECYGSQMPINQVGTMSLPDARTIVVQPWDVSVIHNIEKAIQKADLGLNPIVDGKIIRLPIPALNEERRKDLVKSIHRHAEETKVALRNVRRDANEELKKLKKDSKITEDDEKKGMDRIQKIIDAQIKLIDETAKHKEKDIMEV